MKRRNSYATRIREYIAKHPDAKPNEVAQAVKCSVHNVYAVNKKIKLPNNVRARSTPKPTPTPTPMSGHTDEALAFIAKVLTREELVGFYKASQVLLASGVDPAYTNLYVENLRRVLSPR